MGSGFTRSDNGTAGWNGAGFTTTGWIRGWIGSGFTGKGLIGMIFGKLICGRNDGNGGRFTTIWQSALSAPFVQQYGPLPPLGHFIQ